MNDSNEIDQSELTLLLKFKDLTQKYFQLSVKRSLSDDELNLIDSILERAQDSKVLSDLISNCDRELYQRTLLSGSSVVDSLKDQACQILESLADNSINDATSQLDNFLLLRSNKISGSELKFIYNLDFYSYGVDLSFDLNSNNSDTFLRQKNESFGASKLNGNGNARFSSSSEEFTPTNIEYSNLQRGQFIDQIVDLYSPKDECTQLIREYFYISSGAVVSEAQSDRVEEILDQSQSDPILRSFIDEIDRWILEGANLMNTERCKEYESQKLELKAFVWGQQIALDAVVVHQPRYSPVLPSEYDRQKTKRIEMAWKRPNIKPLSWNPFQKFGINLRAKMTDLLSNPRLLGAICLTTMAGAFVSLLFLNPKYFSVFLNNDSSSGQRSIRSFSSFSNALSTSEQEHSNSDNIFSLQHEGNWEKSPASSTVITSSNAYHVHELISALERGQSFSENSQQSSEWSQKSAEARQLMAESYQKFAETQQQLASAKQARAEEQQQQTRAELWLAKAQEWRDLATRWANQSAVEKSQAQEYLRDSQRYLSRARQYLSATDSVRAEDVQSVNISEVQSVNISTEITPSPSPKFNQLERGDFLLTSSHNVLFAGQLAIVTISAVGLGVSIGARQSRRTAR